MSQIVLDHQNLEWHPTAAPLLLAGRQVRDGRTSVKQFPATNRYGRGRVHPNFDLIPAYRENPDLDVRSNLDRTIPLARQNQHGYCSLTNRPPEASGGAIYPFVLQLRPANAELLVGLTSGSSADTP